MRTAAAEWKPCAMKLAGKELTGKYDTSGAGTGAITLRLEGYDFSEDAARLVRLMNNVHSAGVTSDFDFRCTDFFMEGRCLITSCDSPLSVSPGAKTRAIDNYFEVNFWITEVSEFKPKNKGAHDKKQKSQSNN